MANPLFSDILDELFQEPEGGHLELFVSNPFAGTLLPLPTPPPPPLRSSATAHQLLPPLGPPHATSSPRRSVPLNPTSLFSPHRDASSLGIDHSALPNPPTSIGDLPRNSTPLFPRLSPPPSLGVGSCPSISRNLPAYSPSQNGRRVRQGAINTSDSWGFGFPGLPDSDDSFLEAIATGDFSSPSIAPRSPHPGQPRGRSPPAEETLPGSSADLAVAASATHQDPGMPSTRECKRRVEDASSSGSPVSKRRRPSHENPNTPEQKTKRPRTTPTKAEFDVDESIFLDSDDKDIVNLADPEPEPEVPSEPEVDNSVTLGTFQCVICMDNVTDLTVTYCGHLFCAECLHSSLHIDVTKKICPICRQKIDARPASGKFTTRSKGFWPLELKLMTAKRNGKLPAR